MQRYDILKTIFSIWCDIYSAIACLVFNETLELNWSGIVFKHFLSIVIMQDKQIGYKHRSQIHRAVDNKVFMF